MSKRSEREYGQALEEFIEKMDAIDAPVSEYQDALRTAIGRLQDCLSASRAMSRDQECE